MLRYYLAAVVLCYDVSLSAIGVLLLLDVEFTPPVLDALALVTIGVAVVVIAWAVKNGHGFVDLQEGRK